MTSSGVLLTEVHAETWEMRGSSIQRGAQLAQVTILKKQGRLTVDYSSDSDDGLLATAPV
jgi:hypothetical protein